MLFLLAYRPNSFSAEEKTAGRSIEAEWLVESKAAHEAEKEIARKKGRFFHGLPWIRVIVDAGWQKQSHGHNYTSSSG
jgi:hypothetical protein